MSKPCALWIPPFPRCFSASYYEFDSTCLTFWRWSCLWFRNSCGILDTPTLPTGAHSGQGRWPAKPLWTTNCPNPYEGPMEDRSDGTQCQRLYGAWMPAHYRLGTDRVGLEDASIFKPPQFLLISLVLHLNHNHTARKLHWILIFASSKQFQRLSHHFSLLFRSTKSTDNPNHVLHLVLLWLSVRPSQRWASQHLHRMRYYALRWLLPWGQHPRLQHNAQLLSWIARLPIYSCSELHRYIIKSTTHNGAHRKQHDFYSGSVARPRSQFRRPFWNQEPWRNLHVFLLPMQWRTQGLQRPATLRDVQPCCLQQLHTSRQVS